jgi:hypothetical protein
MIIDLWIASVGILFIYKFKKIYNNKKTKATIIKPLYIYKNKQSQNIPIPNMNMFTNTDNYTTSYDYDLFIKTRSKSLPIIYEDKSL